MRKISVGDFKLGITERNAIIDVLDKGRLSEGKKTKEFEKLWANYIGTKYAITATSGTSALMLGLSAMASIDKEKSKKRKKIITTPVTYIATVNAIVNTNFEPVFVDIDSKTFNITPENIERHLKNIKDIENYIAILPVHLMGYPCDMDKINEIAKKYDLFVIEDSAQAHGTIYKNKKVGSMSLFSIFSFYIAHNIQAGEMGTINTDNDIINKLSRKLKANGRLCDCSVCVRNEGKCPHLSMDKEDHDPRFTHDLIGYNFKITEFQAALGITQVQKADEIFKKRQINVKYLNENLNKFSSLLQLPVFLENVSYLAYPIVIKNPKIISRKELRTKLEEEGIETRPIFGCIPTQQPAYSHLKENYTGKLPNAEYIGNNGFYIGCHQYLEKEDLDYIISTFEKILKGL